MQLLHRTAIGSACCVYGLQSTRHTVNSTQAKIGLNRKWVNSSQSTHHNPVEYRCWLSAKAIHVHSWRNSKHYDDLCMSCRPKRHQL